MSTKEPDWSQFQSIDHINASIALGGLISELEEKAGAGLPWITDPKSREQMEQRQTDLLQHAREFAEIWKERRKECGRVPAFPGAFYARQAPQFDDFTQRAIMLLRDYETCHTLEMQFTCDMITGLLEKEREAFCNLNKQIEILRAKAGESEAFRGQAQALEKVCKVLEKRIQENQTITEMLREKKRAPRPKLTQAEAAACCGVSEKTIRNWDSGATKAPDWYPGRDVTAVEMKMRAQHGGLQDRMAKAARKEIENARKYREEED